MLKIFITFFFCSELHLNFRGILDTIFGRSINVNFELLHATVVYFDENVDRNNEERIFCRKRIAEAEVLLNMIGKTSYFDARFLQIDKFCCGLHSNQPTHSHRFAELFHYNEILAENTPLDERPLNLKIWSRKIYFLMCYIF